MKKIIAIFALALSPSAFAGATCVSADCVISDVLPTTKYFYSTNVVDLTSAKYSIFITDRLDERQYATAKSYITTDPVVGLRANHRVFITNDKINAVRVSKNILLTKKSSLGSRTEKCVFATKDKEMAENVGRRLFVARLRSDEFVYGKLYFITTDAVQGLTADIVVYSPAPFETYRDFLNLNISNPVVPYVLW